MDFPRLGKVYGRMTLDKIKVGESAVITRVGGEGDLRLRLLDMGLIPRTEVTLIKTAPLGDPMEFRLRGYELTLRKESAREIEVVPVTVKKAEESVGGASGAVSASGAADGIGAGKAGKKEKRRGRR